MYTLNLVKPEDTDINYKVSKFPDGQQQVTITLFPCGAINPAVTIKSRLNTFKDLEVISCAVRSLRNCGVKEIHLYAPYFIGGRSDRKFEGGSNNYIKEIIAPYINLLGFESVTVMDPHSNVLEACINNFEKIDNHSLVEWALKSLIIDRMDNLKAVLVAPDAGATHKIYKLAEQIGYKGDVITCTKERDDDGKLSKIVVPNFRVGYVESDIIIIDDICDGGATFINIAKEIKGLQATIRGSIGKYGKHFKPGKLYLIVTHGIFSKGLKELSTYFDGIYSTNSYSDWDYSDLKEGEEKILKQLDIF